MVCIPLLLANLVAAIPSFAGAAAAAPANATALLRLADDTKTADYAKFVEMLATLDGERDAFSEYDRTYLDYLKGWRQVYDREYALAIPTLKAIVDGSKDLTLRFRADVTLTNALALAGQYEEAYRRLSETLELQADVPDRTQRMFGFAVAALLNNQAGQYELASEYADRWLEEEAPANHAGICKALSLKVEALYGSRKLKLDDTLAQRGIDACRAASEPMFANRVRNFVAGLDIDQDRTANAIEILQGSYPEVRRTGYPLLMAESDSVLAKAFWKKGDVKQAKLYAQRAIDESPSGDVIKPVVDAYEVLFEAAKKEGDLANALSFHEKYAAADKGFLNDTTARTLAYQIVMQQVLEKKHQIDVLNERNQVLQLQEEVASKAAETERLYVALLVFGVAFIGYWAYRTKRAQIRFQNLARRDGLTGIVNRQHFMDEAKMALQYAAKSGREVALILIDLDNFKVINDTHGHAAGDAVLKQAVSVCQVHMRSVDLFGRLGGEEFGVLLPECTLEVARNRAEELRVAIASIVNSDIKLPISASFGVTSTRESGHDLRQMLIHADSALYHAKHEGRNRVESIDGVPEAVVAT